MYKPPEGLEVTEKNASSPRHKVSESTVNEVILGIGLTTISIVSAATSEHPGMVTVTL